MYHKQNNTLLWSNYVIIYLWTVYVKYFESGIQHHNPTPHPFIILVLQKLLAVKNRVKGNKYWKIVDFVYEFVELSPFVECACFVEINV